MQKLKKNGSPTCPSSARPRCRLAPTAARRRTRPPHDAAPPAAARPSRPAAPPSARHRFPPAVLRPPRCTCAPAPLLRAGASSLAAACCCSARCSPVAEHPCSDYCAPPQPRRRPPRLRLPRAPAPPRGSVACSLPAVLPSHRFQAPAAAPPSSASRHSTPARRRHARPARRRHAPPARRP